LIDALLNFLLSNGERISSTFIYLLTAIYLFANCEKKDKANRAELKSVLDRYHEQAEDHIEILQKLVDRLDHDIR
jgi:hypothetical protein